MSEGATGLARTLGISAGGEGKPDVLQHEGSFEYYSSVSRAGSSYKYLEADHNPAVRDMKTATKWTLGPLAGSAPSEKLETHPKIAAPPSAASQRIVRKRLRAALSQRLTVTNFTSGTGGADIVRADKSAQNDEIGRH